MTATTTANPFDDEMDAGAGAGIDLSAFDDDFDAAAEPEFDELADGKYQVRIDKAQVSQSSAGDPMIKWELLVIAGSHEGRRIFKNSVITDRSLPFVKGDLKKVGLELKRLSELPARIGEALDKTLEVTKKTKGEYVNVYFNRLLAIPSGEGGPVETPW